MFETSVQNIFLCTCVVRRARHESQVLNLISRSPKFTVDNFLCCEVRSNKLQIVQVLRSHNTFERLWRLDRKSEKEFQRRRATGVAK